MSNLETVPKNGSLTNKNSKVNFSNVSHLLDDIFKREIPSVFGANFNHGLTLPKVNIRETADAYLVEMAVPGLKKSDFRIELDNQELSISTETKAEDEKQEGNYTRREFGYSAFKRSFSLPETVEEENINASYTEGILNIHLPKKEEAKQKPPRTIAIS